VKGSFEGKKIAPPAVPTCLCSTLMPWIGALSSEVHGMEYPKNQIGQRPNPPKSMVEKI